MSPPNENNPLHEIQDSTAQEKRLQAALQAAYAVDDPQPNQKARILRKARLEHDRRAEKRRRVRQWFQQGAVGAVLLLVICAFFAQPYILGFATVSRMRSALRGQTFVHLTQYKEMPNGPQIKVREFWLQRDGLWREDWNGKPMKLLSGEKLFSYDPSQTLLSASAVDLSFVAANAGRKNSSDEARSIGNGLSSSVMPLLDGMTHWEWGDRFRVTQEEAKAGRTIRTIEMDRGRGTPRSLVQVDVESALPAAREEQQETAQAPPKTYARTEYTFTPFDPHKVTLEFLKQTSLVRLFSGDDDTRLASIQNALTLGCFQAAALAVVDAQTNAQGDVFLLCRANTDWWGTLTDDLGTVYTRTEEPSRPLRLPAGLMKFKVEPKARLDIWHFTPKGQPKQTPQRFKLTCLPDATPPPHGNTPLVLPFAVKRPVAALIPDFADAVPAKERPNKWRITLARLEVQAAVAYSDYEHTHQQADLNIATECILQALQMANSQPERISPQTWFDLYVHLKQLGRIIEAKAALKRLSHLKLPRNDAETNFYFDVMEAYKREGIRW